MIYDFLKALGQEKTNTIDDFHITTFSVLNKTAPIGMPPYSKDFYQINFITKAYSSKIRVDDKASGLVNNTLYFVSPQHIYSWKRAEKIEGYLIYFKMDFLNLFKLDFDEEFDGLFSLKEDNLLRLDKSEAEQIENAIKTMRFGYEGEERFRQQQLISNLVSFLYLIKGMKVRKTQQVQTNSKTNKTIKQFRNLVRNRFIAEKSVQYYAEQLSVSPNYLNELSKKERMVSPKRYIQNFILREAKNLLAHTKKDVAEIAFHLGYEEPTHFTRFFKAQTKVTPLAFRKNLL